MREDSRATSATGRVLGTIDHVMALVEDGKLVEATASARVNWLTDAALAVLPRQTVCDLQMHVDSAWVALSAGNKEAAVQALRRARRLIPQGIDPGPGR